MGTIEGMFKMCKALINWQSSTILFCKRAEQTLFIQGKGEIMPDRKKKRRLLVIRQKTVIQI